MKYFFVAALSVIVCSCSAEPKGFDKLNLQSGEAGVVSMDSIAVPPKDGEMSWERSEASTLTAYVRRTRECSSHPYLNMAGTEYEKDKIVLCYEFRQNPQGQALSSPASCPEDVLIKYEIIGLPENVEPAFEVKEGCPGSAITQP